MAEPILLVLGRNSEKMLGFAPHGAGRNLSRTALRRQYPGDQAKEVAIRKSTAGIDVRWYCGKPDLSETPIAYKNAARIREQIEHFALAQIIAEIQPLGCIMAGDSGRSWRDREDELTPKQKRQIEHRAECRKVKRHLGCVDDDDD
jgi:RNA-splicing ligase RtcB